MYFTPVIFHYIFEKIRKLYKPRLYYGCRTNGVQCWTNEVTSRPQGCTENGICPRGWKMNTQKITIRLPKQLIDKVDMFIAMGEFGSRSEALRRALRDYLEQLATVYAEKAESWKKLQELHELSKVFEDIGK